MIEWEAWCYRCRNRESGVETDEPTASGRIAQFRRDHQSSCGMGVSIGSSIQTQVVSLTGDAHTREGESGA